MPVDGEIGLREQQALARRDAELQLDEVRRVIASVTGCSTWRRVFISMK